MMKRLVQTRNLGLAVDTIVVYSEVPHPSVKNVLWHGEGVIYLLT